MRRQNSVMLANSGQADNLKRSRGLLIDKTDDNDAGVNGAISRVHNYGRMMSPNWLRLLTRIFSSGDPRGEVALFV